MRLAILLTLLALSGCSLFRPTTEACDRTPGYAGARDLPRLVVPEGVAAPDTSNALDIPPATGPAPSLDGRCIDAPPSFKVDKGPAKG